MASQRLLLTLFILFIIFITHDSNNQQPLSSATLSTQRDSGEELPEDRAAIDALEPLSYGSFDPEAGKWLNVTGFQSHGSISWAQFSKVKERARESVGLVLGEDWNGGEEVDGGKGSREGHGGDAGVLPFYRNVSGVVVGGWRAVEEETDDGLTVPVQEGDNLTTWGGAMLDRRYDRNITAHDGRVKVLFTQEESPIESEKGTVAEITAHMTVYDDLGFGHEWDFWLRGINFLDSGVVILSTISEKFDGLLGLSSLTLSESEHGLSKELLIQLVTKSNDGAEPELEPDLGPEFSPLSTESDELDTPHSTPQCELVVYLQQQPLYIQSSPYGLSGLHSRASLSRMEHHLRHPDGHRYFAVPDIAMSMTAYSPDCDYIIQSDSQPSHTFEAGPYLRGPKIEVLFSRARRDISIFAAVIIIEIWLTIRQMKEASTPSMRSRISLHTVTLLSLGDGFASYVLVVMGLLFDAASMVLVATAFFAFLGFKFYDTRFLVELWSVQAPQRQRQERQERARATDVVTPTRALAPTSETPNTDGLPLPVTARQTTGNARSAGLNTWNMNTEESNARTNALITANAIRTLTSGDLNTLCSKINLLLLIIAFFSIYSAVWSPLLRTIYIHSLSLINLSMWLPQIYRNVQRNCRKALRWEFVFGRSVIRLAPYAYFHMYANNIVFKIPAPKAFCCLSAWVLLQALVLVLMSLVGPRFFVPHGWAPPAYDYHPVLHEGDEEGGGSLLPVGFSVVEDDNGSPTNSTKPKQHSKPLATFPDINDTTSASPSNSTSNPPSSSLISSSNPPSALTEVIGAVGAESSRSYKNNRYKQRIYDCAICMQHINVPIIIITTTTTTPSLASRQPSSLGSSFTTTAAAAATATATAAVTFPTAGRTAGLLARRQYMVTPCRHIFHTACLEGWMRYRLQCPICRDVLPAL